MDLKNNLALDLKVLRLTSRISLHHILLEQHPVISGLCVYLLYAVVIFYSFYYLWDRLLSSQCLPHQIPWAGAEHQNAIGRGRASLRSLFGLDDLLLDGYLKYSKYGKPFILPNIFTGHEVILPMSDMRWLQRQADSVLSQHETNKQFLRADYTMLDHRIIAEARLKNFIRQELTQDLDNHASAVVEEIVRGLDEFCGSDTDQWNSIPVYDVMLTIVGRLVNRVLVGLPLCRDQSYINASTKFAQSIVITAGLINLLPGWLRPVLGPLLTIYDHRQSRQLAKVIQPLVRQRAADFSRGKFPSRRDDSEYPNDFITWALRDAYNDPDPKACSSELITNRLIVLGFAAIQSSAITVTNALFDIAASPTCSSIQQALRCEALSVPSDWSRSTLAKMVRVDSLLRESLRLWGFVSHGVTKAVVAKNGVTLPSGQHLPVGAKCGIASYGPHHDADVYDNPYKFEPFRFCDDSRTEKNGGTRTFVTTGDYYMGFSHGRHACPGRFFASQQLKLLLAHIVIRYDIEPIAQRPVNRWLNNTIAPPLRDTLRMRRRKVGADGGLVVPERMDLSRRITS